MADATIRPVSAGTGNWDVTTVANINEVITQPSTAGDGTYARHNGASTKIQEWNLTAPSDAGTITGVVVWMRVSCAEFGDNEMSVRIKTNGTWHSLSCTSDPFLSDIEEWKSYTGTFSGGAMVGSAPVLEVTGTGTSSSSRGYLHNAYGLLAYTPAPAEQYAVKSGNWNDPTVWSTTAVPTVGTVYSNNYDVTVNVNASATVVTNVSGTVAIAGGSFAMSSGVTLTANAYAGPSVCVTSGTVSATFVGDSYGGSASNAYGISKSTAGTLIFTGNTHAGSGTSAHGAYVSGAGTINISGNTYGSDSIASAYGVRNNSTGTITVGGSSYAGAASAGAYTASTGTLAIAGYSYASSGAAGVINAGSGTNVTIGMNAVGGSSSTSYGALNSSTGTITVAGAAISADSPGLGAGVANTGSGYSTVGSVVTGTSGVSPCVGHVHVADLSAFTALVRSSSSSVTLSSEVGLSSPFEPSPVFGGA